MTRPARNQAGPHRPVPSEPIPPGQLWPLEFLHSHCAYGARARAALIGLGLPVYAFHKRKWIFTDDLIRILTRKPDSESRGEPGETQDTTAVSGNGCAKQC
jgi:hypothetical protein